MGMECKQTKKHYNEKTLYKEKTLYNEKKKILHVQQNLTKVIDTKRR